MIRFFIATAFVLVAASAGAAEISPHDLTFREAAIIASRMPSPDGENFLFGKRQWWNGGQLINQDDIRSAYEGLTNVLKSEAAQKFARDNFSKDSYYWVRVEKFDGTVGDWKMSQFDGQQFHVFADGTRYNFEVVKSWKGPLEVPLTTDSGKRRKSYGEFRVDGIPAGTWKHRKGVRK